MGFNEKTLCKRLHKVKLLITFDNQLIIVF